MYICIQASPCLSMYNTYRILLENVGRLIYEAMYMYQSSLLNFRGKLGRQSFPRKLRRREDYPFTIYMYLVRLK